MHKPNSNLENKMHKILWDFVIQMDHPIPARRPEQMLINKKICHLVDFTIPMVLE